MSITYEYGIDLVISEAIPSVKELTDRVNETMKGFGFNEKMLVMSDYPIIKITSDRTLTSEELNAFKTVCDKDFSEFLSKYPSSKTYLKRKGPE